jgi:hypothetical protein
MVSHHQGAIRMARVVLEETEDDETRSLAEAIVRTQSDEIDAGRAAVHKNESNPRLRVASSRAGRVLIVSQVNPHWRT